MRIDAHQHYWKTERNDYGWLTPETGLLYKDYLPEQLHGHLNKHAIDRTIVVQAAPTVEETEFLLSLCEQDPTLAGVVGWIDLEADDFRETYARLRQNPYFVGIRPMLQDLPDDRWILRPKVLEALQVLAADRFAIDLLAKPRHLPHIVELLERVPDLHAVVDHIAKPFIKDRIMEPWGEHIRQIAAYGNVFCKLSGMVNEADTDWKPDDFVPYVRHVVEAFGPDRLLFGSDWPVCLLAASYDQVIGLVQQTLPSTLTADELEAIFGGNAIRFYGLDRN